MDGRAAAGDGAAVMAFLVLMILALLVAGSQLVINPEDVMRRSGMQALGVLLLLSALAGDVYGITWDFSETGDTQGWSARQPDGRRLAGEMTGEAWRVRVPPYAADELLDPWANSVALVSPRIGHDSALFDELRLRFRVVTATPYRGGMILRWRNPHNRAQPGYPQYWVSAVGLSVITGEWQEMAFTGLRDGADCGYPLYTAGVPGPCSLVWEGELLDLRIELPTWDAGTGSQMGGEGVAQGVEVDWIRLTGFGEQIEGELPPPAVTSAGPVGTLFEAARFSLLEVAKTGMVLGAWYPGEALGDVDRDGRADVLALWEKDLVGEKSPRSGWFIALGDGLGGFPRLVDQGELSHQGAMCRLAGGDLDNDGDLDAVVMVGMDTPELLMNNEREGWVRVPLPGAGERRLMLLGVGDADADGDVDVWLNDGGEDVGVLVNQGAAPAELRYWRPSGAASGAFPFRLVPGLGPSRVTGALWGGPMESLGRAYTVSYLGVDGEVVVAHLGPAPFRQLQGVADLDGDGDVDLLLHREEELDPSLAYRGLQVLQNQGDGTWGETEWQPEARLLCPPTLSDVNGDGLLDVIWADATRYDPGVVVALGRVGELPRTEGRYPLSGGTGGPLLAGDVNGDGQPDLVVLEQDGYAGNGVHVLLNTGRATAVAEEGGRTTPAGFQLGAAYPNPFNPQTWIPVTVPAGAEPVRLQVYDVLGRPIRSLMSGGLRPGYQVVLWDGRDEAGQTVAAGVYLYRLEGRGWAQSRKMVKVD